MKAISAAVMAVGFCLIMPASASAEVAQPAAKPAIIIPDSATATAYTPGQGFADRNGNFSAMLVVVPQQELAQFDRPADQGRQLNRVNRAEAGAVLAIKLLYTGLTADRNGNGEVTYDLQVYQPDGKLYGASDYRHLAGTRGPIGDGKAVYDNREKVVLIQFEPQDPIGIYTVQAIARDEVAEITVPVQARVELLASVAAVPPQTSVPAVDTLATKPVVKAKTKAKKTYRRKRRHR